MTEQGAIQSAAKFAQQKKGTIAAISALLLVPCFWQRHIEAGDLGSHVYNAWLAQLIEKGQAPGLYFSRQWGNILFDVILLKLGNRFGLAAAEKIAVSICVLIFFWGAFTLIAAVTERAPWFLIPCLAALTYGWTFNVGFFNYYLSLAIGFFATAIFWSGRGRELLFGVALGALALVAHPQGFVWLVGCVSYVLLWKKLPGAYKLILPLIAAATIVFVGIFLSRHYESYPVWRTFGPGIFGGSDQLALYDTKSYGLSVAALIFGLICFAADAWRRLEKRESWRVLRLPLELYGVVVLATYALPDSVRMPMFPGWIGAMALRLTTISAVLGLCVLGFMKPRKWHTIGFGIVGALFFAFLYQDTAVLNRMERQAESLVAGLPNGERVLYTIWTPRESRLPFIAHIVDRACIGNCFSYGNYEPASGEFRVRVREGSPIAISDPDDSEATESGEYAVQKSELPMAQIYQCDEKDLTKLCVRQLAAGETNGRLGYRPAVE